MQEHISVLFCEDSTDDFLLMKLSLQHLENPVLCERVQQTETLREMLKSQLFDLYILDYDIPGYHIYDFLDIIKSYDSDASVIVVSGTITEEQVMKALERGASDYVMKDNLQRLPYAVRNEFINSRTRRSLKTSREKSGKNGRPAPRLPGKCGRCNLHQIYRRNDQLCEPVLQRRVRYIRRRTRGKVVPGFCASGRS